jgi:ribosomal protein S12 methylthiotransferase accessory factor
MTEAAIASVFGKGPEARQAARLLSVPLTDGLRVIGAGCGPVLLCLPRCEIESASKAFWDECLPHLAVWWFFGEIGVGPLVRPGQPGCITCFARREDNNASPLSVLRAERDSEIPVPGRAEDTAFTLAIAAAAQLASWGDCGRVVLIGASGGVVSTHRFLADPLCPCCGRRVEDRAETVRRPAASVPTPNGWRHRDYRAELSKLKKSFVDPRAGIVKTVGTDVTTSLCAPGPARHHIGAYDHEDWTAGLTHSFPHSQAVGIIEAIERYAGLRPRAKKTAVRGRYDRLAGEAVNPRSFVLYEDAQYALPGFPCRPFSEDLELSWVWGWSARRDGPVLVAEQLIYYEVGAYDRNELFVIENSNGCAAGGSFEEALIHGAFEAVERDSVLRAWYRRQPLARVDLFTCRDPELIEALRRFEETTDYAIAAYDATQDLGIPTIWIVAYGRSGEGPSTFSASKAHPDAERALAGAFAELCGAIHYHEAQYAKRRPNLLPMLEDPSLVCEEFDHTLLAGLPEARNRFTFLEAKVLAPRSLLDMTLPDAEAWRLNSGVAARGLARKVLALGLDLIAVDQTPPEAGAFGLSVVKVLIPGLIPFTLGHNYRRLATMRIEPARRADALPHPFA